MKKRAYVVGVFTLVACAATRYFHGVLGTDVVFPHLYYLPIILAAIWWERRSWFLTAFLSAFLLASHVISGIEVPITSDLARAASFLLVGGVAAELSRARRQATGTVRATYGQQAAILASMLDAVIVANPDGTIRTLNRAALELLGYSAEEIIGRPVGIIFEEEEEEEEEEEFFRGTGLAKLVREGAARHVELTLLAKSGERIPVVINGSVIRDDEGGLHAVLGVARDMRETRRLWDEVLRAEATLRSLNAASLAVQRALEPQDVFRVVASELKKLGLLATIFLLDEDEKNLTIAHMSFSPELIKGAEKLLGLSRSIRFPLDRMPQYIGEVLGNRVTVFSQASERIAGFLPAHLRGLGGKLVEILGLHKGIVAPLVVEGEVIGALGVDSQELTENDVPAITAFANQVSIALENARLYERAQQEIAERVRAEEQLKASLQEKEVFLKELHHRVKNNLQVISSLLDLATEYMEDKGALETLNESRNRVKSMALVHEQLYQSESLARIDFAEYVRSLAARLFYSCRVNQDSITLKVNAADVFLGVDAAIPCGLIINELISNSLRHAFPAGGASSERSESRGEIRIDLHSHDDKLTLIVSDNGIGFPQDLDFRNTESLGLRLVGMLARQLGGTIELDRNGGTTFKIAFARQ